MLNCDALAKVMTFAPPQDAVAIAQSCKDLHTIHRAQKEALKLDKLQKLRELHTLGLAPNRAYVHLVVPEDLINLAAQKLTSFDIDRIILAFKPDLDRLKSFVQRIFRDRLCSDLRVSLLIPGTFGMILCRDAVAPLLRSLLETVTRDIKALMSSYAQACPTLTELEMYYDIEVVIEGTSLQTCEDLYVQVESQLGQQVADALLDKAEFVCDVTGHRQCQVQWKETGLPALFGRIPSQLEEVAGISDVDCEESGSAQLWRFTSEAAQIIPISKFGLADLQWI